MGLQPLSADSYIWFVDNARTRLSTIVGAVNLSDAE